MSRGADGAGAGSERGRKMRWGRAAEGSTRTKGQYAGAAPNGCPPTPTCSWSGTPFPAASPSHLHPAVDRPAARRHRLFLLAPAAPLAAEGGVGRRGRGFCVLAHSQRSADTHAHGVVAAPLGAGARASAHTMDTPVSTLRWQVRCESAWVELGAHIVLALRARWRRLAGAASLVVLVLVLVPVRPLSVLKSLRLLEQSNLSQEHLREERPMSGQDNSETEIKNGREGGGLGEGEENRKTQRASRGRGTRRPGEAEQHPQASIPPIEYVPNVDVCVANRESAKNDGVITNGTFPQRLGSVSAPKPSTPTSTTLVWGKRQMEEKKRRGEWGGTCNGRQVVIEVLDFGCGRRAQESGMGEASKVQGRKKMNKTKAEEGMSEGERSAINRCAIEEGAALAVGGRGRDGAVGLLGWAAVVWTGSGRRRECGLVAVVGWVVGWWWSAWSAAGGGGLTVAVLDDGNVTHNGQSEFYGGSCTAVSLPMEYKGPISYGHPPKKMSSPKVKKTWLQPSSRRTKL
ncbi:hypothetical protein C8J57DRAFT_1233583 [Mycena rebaudengoi]|nr:hypothetical protein C8J57DRAFT_1233583 [Mycena rebaudengoi]